MTKKDRIVKIYDALYERYGPQGWWPVIKQIKNGEFKSFYHKNDFSFPKNKDQLFEICVGAILTQNTSWKNVEKALINLKNAKMLNCDSIVKADEKEIGELIKPSGYYNQKSERLKIFAEWFNSLKKNPTREELLALKGIGEETADSILLYGFKIPSFVVDAYTKRILSNLSLINGNSSYSEIQKLFESILPEDFRIYQEYHALLVEHAKHFYIKRQNKEDFLLELS
ncbi:MAG: endonuclease related protein [Candidatus Woesearchaeota archaeon]|nr:endonuclease related protein [Candidatus Woesearchaeota archaeon]